MAIVRSLGCVRTVHPLLLQASPAWRSKAVYCPLSLVGLNSSPHKHMIKVAVASLEDQTRYKPVEALVDPHSTFVLPPISACSLPVRVHEAYDHIREVCDAWMLSMMEPPQLCQQRREFYVRSAFPLLTCAQYPASAHHPDRLILITKITVLLSVLDDTVDDVTVDLQSAKHLLGCVVAILRGDERRPLLNRSATNPRLASFLDVFFQVWEEMCHDMATCLKARMAHSLLRSLESVKHQTVSRVQGDPSQPFTTFMAARSSDSFAELVLLFGEYGIGLQLEDEIFCTPAMQELNVSVCNYLAYVNDLFSFRKEYMRGDIHNLPSVLGFMQCNFPSVASTTSLDSKLEACTTFQMIVDEVWNMIQAQLRRCMELIEEIRTSTSATTHQHSDLLVYLEMIGAILPGNLLWSSTCARYNGNKPLSWKTTNSISLLPDSTLLDYDLNLLRYV